MLNQTLLRKATKEQLSEYGRRSQHVQAIARMMREPQIYRPVSPQFCGFVMACSFQLCEPVIHTMQLYDTGRYDSFRAIIDNEKQNDRGGWYRQMEILAGMMPRRILQE